MILYNGKKTELLQMTDKINVQLAGKIDTDITITQTHKFTHTHTLKKANTTLLNREILASKQENNHIKSFVL